MAGDVENKHGSKNVKKLQRLPKNARVTKRPLLHPQISSPYSGPKTQKVVYVSTRTPFMSAVKRVRNLLNQVNKRAIQSEMSRQRKSRSKKQAAASSFSKSPAPEPVVIKATGKAIDKALNLALFFQNQNDLDVKIKTGTVSAIDDIEIQDDLSADVPSHTLDSDLQSGDSHNLDVAMPQASVSKPDLLEDELPDSRIRNTSCIEIFVTMR